MGKVVLINKGTRGAVDLDLPDTGKEHEMIVRRKKRSDKGIAEEVVSQIVKVRRPHSIHFKIGDRHVLDDSILKDPVTASRIRSGVFAVQKWREKKVKEVEGKKAEEAKAEETKAEDKAPRASSRRAR